MDNDGVPAYLLDPVSGRLLDDPRVVRGHTYHAETVSRLLARGSPLPADGLTFGPADVFVNAALQRAAAAWTRGSRARVYLAMARMLQLIPNSNLY